MLRGVAIKRLQHVFCSLLVLGALSTVVAAQAHDGFTRRTIAGTWVFSADGTIVTAGTPLTLVGLSTFKENGECALALTINVGGPSWPSTSATCMFTVQPDGMGALEATFVPSGPVTFPPLPLSFVIVDRTEMRAIRTDGVVASGVFRRQARGGRGGQEED
jgi:hypothetical protein